MIVPRPRSEMRRIREVLRLRTELGSNLSAIATGARLARSTVRAYLARAAAGWSGSRCGGRAVGRGAGGGAVPAGAGGRGTCGAGLVGDRPGIAAPQARDAQAAVAGVQDRPSGRL